MSAVHFVYPDSVVTSTQVGLLATRSLDALRAGDVAAALAAADTGRALVDVRPPASPPEDPAGLAALGWAESWLERYTDAEAHLRAGITAARRSGAAEMLPAMLTSLAHVASWTGRLPEAVRLCRGARRHGDRQVRGAVNALEAIVVLWIGGRDSQARGLELARAAVGESGLDDWWGRVAMASLGQARLFSDDAAGCVRLILDAGRDADLSALPISLRPMWFSLLSAATLRLGDLDAAEAWSRRAEAIRRQVGLPGQRAFASMAAGQVLIRRGEFAEAAGRLQSAATGFRQSRMSVLQALALVSCARAAAAAGERASATDMLHRAHRIAVACGSPRIVEMATRAENGAPVARRTRPAPRSVRPAATPPPSGRPEEPAGDSLSSLTARERQIAWLAGTGTKTSTVARQLCVSPRTVDVHLSRIYRKLGVPGRAGLVAIVARMDRGWDPAGSPPASSDPGGESGPGLVAHGQPERLHE